MITDQLLDHLEPCGIVDLEQPCYALYLTKQAVFADGPAEGGTGSYQELPKIKIFSLITGSDVLHAVYERAEVVQGVVTYRFAGWFKDKQA